MVISTKKGGFASAKPPFSVENSVLMLLFLFFIEEKRKSNQATIGEPFKVRSIIRCRVAISHVSPKLNGKRRQNKKHSFPCRV